MRIIRTLVEILVHIGALNVEDLLFVAFKDLYVNAPRHAAPEDADAFLCRDTVNSEEEIFFAESYQAALAEMLRANGYRVTPLSEEQLDERYRILSEKAPHF